MTHYEMIKTMRDFKNGDCVIVIDGSGYRRRQLAGKRGVVVEFLTYDGGKYAVKLDNETNALSHKGYFYFRPEQLAFTNENGNKMEEENVMPNVVNYFNAVKVQFLDTTAPCRHVYANFESNLKVGDLCVVKTAHHGLGLARVAEILEGNNYETTREIVTLVDTTVYDERVKFRAKRAELKRQMDERAKQLQDIALYQMLAKEDPDMAEMLTRYQNIPKM